MTRRKSVHVCCDPISCYFSSLACWVYRFWAGAYGKLIILSVQGPEFESESSFHYFVCVCVWDFTHVTQLFCGALVVLVILTWVTQDAETPIAVVTRSPTPSSGALVKLCLLDSTVAQEEPQVASRTVCVCCCLLCYGNTTSPLGG